jgi:hypothetical protein
LILGPGGTGKTTLAHLLAGDVNILIDPPGYYSPSLFAESIPLLGAPEIEIAVLPGQNFRLEREFTKMTGNLANGAYRGLILVVDYGHHAIESEWIKEHRLFKRKKTAFLKSLLEEQRKEELELLDRLLPVFKAITHKFWILVIVLKEDLWSGRRERDAAVKHYRDGPWGARMNELLKSVNPERFYLHTAYASLHIQNFTTRGGRETLKRNVAGYDAVRQRQSLEELFKAFDALREWEAKP